MLKHECFAGLKANKQKSWRMKLKVTNIALAALAAVTLTAGVALAGSDGNYLVHSREFGGQVYMMNQQHMALYTYDKDEPGISNCYGECAVKWPPALLADADMPQNYTLIERQDTTMQIAYKGQPLYLWFRDEEIGDIGGDGIGGVWRLARPTE